jgi:hypothetical protein
MHDPGNGAGPGPPGVLLLWVQGWTVSHLLAGVSVGLGLGSYCSSDCCLSCSPDLDIGCFCSWRSSGLLPCTVPENCVAPGHWPLCLAVSSISSILTGWGCAAWPTLGATRRIAVRSSMPALRRM